MDYLLRFVLSHCVFIVITSVIDIWF